MFQIKRKNCSVSIACNCVSVKTVTCNIKKQSYFLFFLFHYVSFLYIILCFFNGTFFALQFKEERTC